MSDLLEPSIGQNTKHAGGRPPKLTAPERAEVYEAFKEYILDNEDPTLVGFIATNQTAIDYEVSRDNVNDWQEFSTLIKRCIVKQEHYLLTKGGEGKYNPTLAIFRLKQPQHGYKDRTETDITSKGEQVGQTISSEQAAQLIALRAKRGVTN